MIHSFSDKETLLFWETGKSRKFPHSLHQRLMDRLQMIDAAGAVEQLLFPPSNRLEKLSGDYRGYWSLRVNIQYRLVFRFENGHAHDVALVDYH